MLHSTWPSFVTITSPSERAAQNTHQDKGTATVTFKLHFLFFFFCPPAATPAISWGWWNEVDDGLSEGPRFVLGRTTARVLLTHWTVKIKNKIIFPHQVFSRQALAVSVQGLSPADVRKVSWKLNTAWLPDPEPEGEHDWINTLQLHEVTAVWIAGQRMFFSTVNPHWVLSVCSRDFFFSNNNLHHAHVRFQAMRPFVNLPQKLL